MARIILAVLCLSVIVLSEGKATLKSAKDSKAAGNVDRPDDADTPRIVHYRGFPDDPELQKFISSLTSEQRELIKKHPSQAQALLDALHRPADKGATAKRSQVSSNAELEKFISRLPADLQALIRAHPSEAKALLEAIHRPAEHGATAKRNQVSSNAELEKFISRLPADLQALIRAHPSEAKALWEALHSPAEQGAHAKRADLPSNAELQKFISKLPADQQALIRAHPSEAKELLDALHRAGAGSSDGAAYAKKQIEDDEDEQSEENEAKQSEEDEAKQSEEDEAKQSEEDEAKQSEENETEKILQELLPHIAALQDIIENAKNHQHAESAAVEKLKEEIVDDVTRAKQHGIKLEDLLQSINRQDRKH